MKIKSAFLHKALLAGFLIGSINWGCYAQNCKGNGCPFISITGVANGLTVHNSNNQKIHVDISWYYGGCQPNHFDINGGASITFPFRVYCPPYTATVVGGGPPPPKSGSITFVNPIGSGQTVYIYGVTTNPGATFDFCSTNKSIKDKELAPGQSWTYFIPAATMLTWASYSHINGECDGSARESYGSAFSGNCYNGCRTNVK